MEGKKGDMSKEGEEEAKSFEDILPPSPEDIRCLFNSDLNLGNHIIKIIKFDKTWTWQIRVIDMGPVRDGLSYRIKKQTKS